MSSGRRPRAIGRTGRWTGSCRSAELFEVLGRLGDFARQVPEFGDGGAVVGRGDDVFRGAAELEEPVLEGGDLGVGEDDGVFREATALEGGPTFVSPLAARLPAVTAASTDVAALFEASAAPSAVFGCPRAA